jgi:acylphosphatase
MTKEIIYNISGDVQGVFFRANAKRKADELAITGYVQNEPDGRVTVVAQGSDNALRQFQEWARNGPKSAQVENLTSKTRSAKKIYQDFQIKY